MNFNMQNLMKQAQAMQSKMKEAQDIIEKQLFEGNASNLVKVSMTGDYNVQGIEIKPEAVDVDDLAMLEDLLIVATNDALNQIKTEQKNSMGNMPSGMGGMF